MTLGKVRTPKLTSVAQIVKEWQKSWNTLSLVLLFDQTPQK